MAKSKNVRRYKTLGGSMEKASKSKRYNIRKHLLDSLEILDKTFDELRERIHLRTAVGNSLHRGGEDFKHRYFTKHLFEKMIQIDIQRTEFERMFKNLMKLCFD